MTVNESINRGFNLMVTTFLLFAGVAFGLVAVSPVENDWGDRLDDIGLVLVGLASLAWYLIGRNRLKRSRAPAAFAGIALGVQLLAVLLERDDQAAFGDNYIGLAMLVPFFIFVVVEYVWNGRRYFADGSDKGSQNPIMDR